jgi:NADPH-dependent curcumin reductase CurA
MATYKKIVLASRPKGAVTADNFRLEESPVPTLNDGEVLIRNHYLSLDPYMRGRMEETKSYAAPQPIGETMIGGTVGEIVESRNPKFAVGDKVVGMAGWSEMGVSDGVMLRKVDTAHIPLSAYLGAVGMPGMTAWYGLTQIMQPKAGETIVVSAASGAVGSVVGQLARQRGCRAVGIAAVFENVGGDIFDACIARMNPFGRIALCGMIAGYNGEPMALHNVRNFLTMRLSMRGFIVAEHMEFWPQGLTELGTLVATGKLKFRESVAEGIAAAPEAFIGLLKGQNFGKQLVKLV